MARPASEEVGPTPTNPLAAPGISDGTHPGSTASELVGGPPTPDGGPVGSPGPSPVPAQPPSVDPGDLRAARRRRSGGARDRLRLALLPAAERYATRVLALGPGPGTDHVVAAALVRTVRTLPRGLAPTDLTAHLHDAVREEAWRHQRHPDRARRRPVALPVAAPADQPSAAPTSSAPATPAGAPSGARRWWSVLGVVLLLVAAVAAIAWIVVDRRDDPGAGRGADTGIGSSVSTPASTGEGLDDGSASAPGAGAAGGSITGRVVAQGADGRLSARPGTEIRIASQDGIEVATVRTGDDGRFTAPDLEIRTYVVSLAVPAGFQVPNQRAGATPTRLEATVDLAERPDANVVLRLAES